MSFNSYYFIFVFLPVALILYYELAKDKNPNLAKSWLIFISLIFYGSWQPVYLAFLIPSVLINYGIGIAIIKDNVPQLKPKLTLTLGVLFNLALLGYFKYFNFFLSFFNDSLKTSFASIYLIVPLGISFITFEQISYLVDIFKGKNQNPDFLNYSLFVTFFPKLISGPIIRYQELIPQLNQKAGLIFNSENIAIGITLFMSGMFKKLVFADNLAPYTSMAYFAAEKGIHLTFTEAWIGILAHYLQLYFDFSGYSDMAIGVGRMFGIKLPLNFNSPYKALNINQFWTHWHMSLTRFFRDYIYFPLSKKLKLLSLTHQHQTLINIIITMTLTGIWHGAGWNYLVWGFLQGFYLSCYQIWRDWRRNIGWNARDNMWWQNFIAWSLTFLAWTFALVIVKTKTVSAVIIMWRGMLGLNGISLPQNLASNLDFLKSFQVEFNGLIPNLSAQPNFIFPFIFILLIIVWFTPNTQEWMGQYKPALDYFAINKNINWKSKAWSFLQWQQTSLWGGILAIITIVCFYYLSTSKAINFIYFNY